ncbi:MAG: hypothetical protein HWN66_02200 [Candidatus Helarchaeota archaeon]|nr:hypothetical protein [Candidatus Helarchaeota archaeon]
MDTKTENSIRKKSIEILLNKYKSDNEKLIIENKRLEKYKKKIIGYILIFVSVIIFFLSVLIIITEIQIILLSFVSIALISMTIFLIFIYSPKTHQLDLTKDTLKTVFYNLSHAISHFNLEKYATFLPIDEIVYQFVPFISDSSQKKYPTSNELREDILKIPNKGILLHPTGYSLLELIINEFQMDISKVDINNITILLQEILMEQLNLIETLDFVRLDRGRYKLVLIGNIFSLICQLDKPDLNIGTQIGDPICSFVAILLARITKRSILLKSHEFKQKENSSIVIFELGEIYR